MASGLFGPTQQLLCKDGSSVRAGDALRDATYVLVYFAASWCEPRCELAPLLRSFYEEHGSEKAAEVVLLSFDNSERAMMDYFANSDESSYCLPYADACATRTEWMEQCNVKGLPSVAVLRNESPRVVVARYGCNMVASDPKGVSFPWAEADPMPHKPCDCIPEVSVAVTVPMVAGKQGKPSFFDDPAQMLLRKDGSSVPAVDALRDATYVLVYCSAHWCPCCREFTPLLKSFYEAHHIEKKFEIVFMSIDFSEGEMMDYFKRDHGDYYCLPFDDACAMSEEWETLYDFHFIPTLLVFENGYPRVLLKHNGRDMVEEDPSAEYFPWKDKGAVARAGSTSVLPWSTGGKAQHLRLELCLLAVCLLLSVCVLVRMSRAQ
ncbi:tryparedoxin-like protein [Leptomonas seymouri]|uniref:Tryparedoxin-like protein n=1 Tax=Leptomonas seymouri TaxID=5684 RepID=A0A0N1HYA5_LEPSE|nr:tryparedoxin-like protein [Leptomonas seymouri]|eukprot:KPI82592.1 tryparedoxin-like protein [Leptomonas seymouri]